MVRVAGQLTVFAGRWRPRAGGVVGGACGIEVPRVILSWGQVVGAAGGNQGKPQDGAPSAMRLIMAAQSRAGWSRGADRVARMRNGSSACHPKLRGPRAGNRLFSGESWLASGHL